MTESVVRSARLNSLFILLVTYVGLTFAWAHHQRLSLLFEARQTVLQPIVAKTGEVSDFRVPGLGTIEVSIIQERDQEITRVSVDKLRGSRWAVTFFSKKELFRRKSSPKFNLEEIAGEIGIISKSDIDPVVLCQQIEAKLLGVTVNVPGIGLSFQGTFVVWTSLIIMLSLFIVLRNRTTLILEDPQLGGGEPWLIIDGQRGIEVWAARIWLVALLFAPWFLSGALILAYTSQLIADGATTSLWTDAVTAGFMFTLLLANGWLGLNSFSCLLQLREARKQYVDVSEKAPLPE